MKKNKLFLCALASGMLALTGCSDSTDFSETKGANWNADGTGYVSLAINLPQTNSNGNFRSEDNSATDSKNDQFNDGVASEYAVNDAILVLFTGTGDNEANYNFEAAYKLPLSFNMENPADNQITSSARITKKIASVKDNVKIKALVILNAAGAGITCGNGIDVENADNPTLAVGVNTYTNANTFGDFSKEIVALGTKPGNFMMTNAPLYTAASYSTGIPTSGKLVTLADVKAENIKKTAADAAESPASEIYVERSVAKVTLSDARTVDVQNSTIATESASTTLKCKITGFELYNVNDYAYIVRDASGFNNTDNWQNLVSNANGVKAYNGGYRFVGYDKVGNDINGQNLYRTYFGKDVNYDTNIQKQPLNDTKPRVFTEIAPRYCMENTFAVDFQQHKYTTAAVLRVNYSRAGCTNPEGEKDTYAYGNDAHNFFFGISEMKTHIMQEINKNALVQATFKGKVQNIEGIELTARDENTGYCELNSFTITNQDGTDDVVSANNSTYLGVFETIRDIFGKIAVYKDGNAYYSVRIKHFGDDLTPWNGSAGMQEWTAGNQPSASNIYPDLSASNYLGRYGVLRNNWYELNVTRVNRLGSPEVPELTYTWDDELDSYINVKINILSWAVRKQNVELQ